MTIPVTAPSWRPVSAEEQSLWLLERCVPGTGVNNIAFVLRFDGRVAPDVLVEAVTHVVNRHRALHTRYRADGAGLVGAAVPVTMDEIDLVELPGGVADPFSDFVRRPFELDGEVLVRLARTTVSTVDTVAVVVHHLVFDATSVLSFCSELAAAYTAILRDGYVEAVDEPPVAVAVTEETGFWQQYLGGLDPCGLRLDLESPSDSDITLAGAELAHELSPAAVTAVRELSRRLRAPEASVLLAAFCLLLARHGASSDLVVGCPISTRDRAAATAVGFHVNVLPMRVQVSRETGFAELTRRVRRTFFDVMMHNGRGAESRLPRLEGAESPWRNPIFRHVFNYVPVPEVRALRFGDREAHQEHLPVPFSKFDIEYLVIALPEGLMLRTVYSTELHRAQDVAAMLARYEALLVAVAEDSDCPLWMVPMLTVGDLAVLDQATVTVVDDFGAELPPGVWGADAITGERIRLDHDGSINRPVAAAPSLPTQPVDGVLVDALVAVWSQVLMRSDVDAESDFFALGGNSLLGAKLAQTIEEETGVSVTLAEVFEHPAPARLVAHLTALADGRVR
ncbi:condensation domain-containing protein [Kutzneria sp. NPDC052558]|uniref:condensation domain-containing protein n=1 Tax=Kutzneria sp. NPDC052558 TaxID=3364121 RepID=UPI0037CC60FF